MVPESPDEKQPRILARVHKADFVGRGAELQQITEHAQTDHGRALLLQLEPTAGASELLRQAYDNLFYSRRDVAPIYFSMPRHGTPVSVAIEFLNQFLSQYVAFKRNDAAQPLLPATLNELLALTSAGDYEWVSRLVETYN